MSEAPAQSTHSLESLIERLATKTGRGTELVSVYVPPDQRVSDVAATLTEEYGNAANIKSKRTRKNVQSALKSLQARLKHYDTIPENGLALFSGAIEDDGGTTTLETVVVDDLPEPIQSLSYSCSSTFETAPLEAMQTSGPTYGLIVLDKRDAQLGVLNGTTITPVASQSSLVPGKHRAGGQSAQRFARLRLDAVNEFYKKVARSATQAFRDDNIDLDGLLIGGPSPSKDEFIEGEYLHHELQAGLIGVVDLGDTTERGLTELVERGETYLEASELEEQKLVLDRFFTALRTGDAVAYGIDEVEQAGEYGAIETVLIRGERLDTSHGSDLAELAAAQGGEVIEITAGFEKSEQLHQAFEGVAALLRFHV